MADKIINTLITLRTDTSTNWHSNDPTTIRLGEVTLEKLDSSVLDFSDANKPLTGALGSFKLKVGDGSGTKWADLPYLQVNSNEVYDKKRTGDAGFVTVEQRITDLIAATGKISVNGILKGDGTGNVTAAVADTDYRTPGQSKIEFNQTPTGYTQQVPAVITLGSNTLTPATLGTDGKVPATQLPSYVDDVVELKNITGTQPSSPVAGDAYYSPNSAASNKNKIMTYNGSSWVATDPEKGKIYIDLSSDKTYRYGGSAASGLVEISTQAVYTADGTTISLSSGLQFSVVKVPHALTFGLSGGKSFDGHEDVVIKSDDIALTTAWDPSTVLTIDDALQDLLSRVDDCIPKVTYVAADVGKLVQVASGGVLEVTSYKLADLPKRNTQSETFTDGNLVLGAGGDKIKNSTIASDTLALKASNAALTNGHIVKADANGKLTSGIAENVIFEKTSSAALTASRVVVTDANGKATVNAALTAGNLVKVASGGLLTDGIAENTIPVKPNGNALTAKRVLVTDTNGKVIVNTTELTEGNIVKAGSNGYLTNGLAENVIAEKATAAEFTGHEGDFVVVNASGKLTTKEQSDIAQFAPNSAIPGDGELLTVVTDTDSANKYLTSSGILNTNIITTVKKNGTSLTVTDHAVDVIVPVSGSTAVANAVTVDADDHEMYVNSVSTNILVNGTNTFVINGGTAAGAGV